MFIKLIVTNTTRENIDKVATLLEKMIKTVEILVTSKVTEDCVGEISFLFSSLQEIVQPFITDYKRKKKIREDPFYVEPVPICFRSVMKTVRRHQRMFP